MISTTSPIKIDLTVATGQVCIGYTVIGEPVDFILVYEGRTYTQQGVLGSVLPESRTLCFDKSTTEQYAYLTVRYNPNTTTWKFKAICPFIPPSLTPTPTPPPTPTQTPTTTLDAYQCEETIINPSPTPTLTRTPPHTPTQTNTRTPLPSQSPSSTSRSTRTPTPTPTLTPSETKPCTYDDGSFENVLSINRVGNIADLGEWEIHFVRVFLNGRSNIGGWPTPVDNTSNPFRNSFGDTSPANMTYTATLETRNGPPAVPGSKYIALENGGSLANSNVWCGIVRGPYLISKKALKFKQGCTISFWWRAENGGDSYDIFVYLLEVNTGNNVVLLNETQDNTTNTQWTKFTRTITLAEEGEYKFVYINGTYDFSCGGVLGARLLIDEVRVTNCIC